MSYVRFGEDDSDVYVFPTVRGGVECCGCGITAGPSPRFAALQGILDHLAAHRAAGDTVPDHVEPDIRADDAAGRIDWDTDEPDRGPLLIEFGRPE